MIGLRRLLCRIGKHAWKVDEWIPVGSGGKAITRYRCRFCGHVRNVWQRWPATTQRLEQ